MLPATYSLWRLSFHVKQDTVRSVCGIAHASSVTYRRSKAAITVDRIVLKYLEDHQGEISISLTAAGDIREGANGVLQRLQHLLRSW